LTLYFAKVVIINYRVEEITIKDLL